MSEDHLRIGDAERDQAAVSLGEHYARGRLSAEEHSERLDRAMTARTRAELRPLFADLPAPHGPLVPVAPVAPAWQPAPARRRGVPLPVVLLFVVLVAVTVTTHLPFVILGLVVYLLLRSRVRRPPC